MKKKKERNMLNVRQKKRQLGVSLVLIVVLAAGLCWIADMNGLHLSWEKAFYGTEKSYGYGPSEKILLTKDEYVDGLAIMGGSRWFPFSSGTGRFKYAAGRLRQTEEEGYLSVVRVLKTAPFVWQEFHAETIRFAGAAEAHYVKNAEWILGSCQDEKIREVYLEWGYLQENGEWTALDEIVLPVDADGFFYFDIPAENEREMRQRELWSYRKAGDCLLQGVGVKYLEGRNDAGEVIYTKWMDETGRLVDEDSAGR